MDTLLDIRTEVQRDLSVGNESAFYTPEDVDAAINRAYRKIGGLYPWPDLEDAKKTSTQANIEYYDYPKEWRPNSIWKLVVDGVRYGEDPDGSPLTYNDYMLFREDEPTSTDKKWANQWRRYFIYPVPTTTGSYNIEVWGINNVTSLDEDEDITIFSYAQPEVNEAVALEAAAILRTKGQEQKSGQLLSAEAKAIVTTAWTIIKKSKAKYEKDQPFFNVPDYFARTSSTKIGKFDI